MVEDVEDLRQRWNPLRQDIKIKVLFVGESPPKQGFFYNRNTILYFATFCAFSRKFGVDENNFLSFFKKKGCYLYDLFNVSGQKINQVSLQALNNAKQNLMNFISNTQPEAVIVVHKGVYVKIQTLLSQMKNNGIIKKYFSLPFPYGANFVKYVRKLEKILEDLISQNILTIN